MAQSQTSTALARLRYSLGVAGVFLSLFWRNFRRDGCRESAAALTYTTLFAIVPMMTVAFSILAAIPALRERSDTIREWAFSNFAPGVGDQVMVYLGEFSRQATNLTVIGVIFLAVTSILMLRTIEQNMNRIWQVNQSRKGTTSLLMYWAVLTLGPMCLGAGLGISSYLTSVTLLTDAVDLLGGARFWFNLLPLAFTTLMLSMLYIIVPNCFVPLRAGLIGGFVAGLFFEGAKAAFAMFIKLSPSYQVVYGAFAAVPVFLLWIFISWNLVLAGAELTRTIVVFDEHRRRVPHMQSLLRLLEILWERQREGRTLKPDEVRSVLRQVGATHWEEFRNLLMSLSLIRRTEDGDFVLARDLSELTLYELSQMLPWPLRRQLRTGVDLARPWEAEVDRRRQSVQDAMQEQWDVTLDELFMQGLDGERG